MSFLIKDVDVLDKYNEIWSKIKNTLNIKFDRMLVYDEKYIKAKVREFNGVIKTNVLGNEIPKENVLYTCLVCITIDSLMRMKKKSFFWLWASQKLALQQNSFRRNWMPKHFQTTSCHRTPPWLLRLMKVSTSSELYPKTLGSLFIYLFIYLFLNA